MTAQGFPSAAQCVPIAMRSLGVLADLRSWLAGPAAGLENLPIEAMAISAATIAPWRSVGQLRAVARMYVWTYALDDHVEQAVTSLPELDDLFARCLNVVRTNQPDTSHPLLTALSSCQRDLSAQPLYPALAELWAAKFADDLKAVRYDWLVSRGEIPRTDIRDYLDHASSVTLWMNHFPLWATAADADLIDHLDALVSSLDDLTVVVRLANDLATFHRESRTGDNNILMYPGVSPAQVRTELARRAESATARLSALVDRDFAPAVELIRLLEWSTVFYSCGDFRGWGSDAVPEPVLGSAG
ncbi:terpene synthase family protein [Kutzneria sp. CA-103260]|uniref:terpene synthase family protein n=1 Tax=Kutzneria sp. CA-103260 TaxID=2802641 RepID=UPI001BA8C6C9|nr:terpene synthase family protein [Kutzneria sp. CA-103260]QUQ68338.1 Ent-pimara-9(11),15-diene synthase [Kutzneria sp. CA-103260]